MCAKARLLDSNAGRRQSSSDATSGGTPHFIQGGGTHSAPVLVQGAMKFSKERLEGRALEHALAGDLAKRRSIRMYDDVAEKWVNVDDYVAKGAMAYMRGRCRELEEELRERGLKCCGGDKAAHVDGKTLSVDLYLHCGRRNRKALVEVK